MDPQVSDEQLKLPVETMSLGDEATDTPSKITQAAEPKTLISLPAEVVALILEACDDEKDVLSAIMTCKTMNAKFRQWPGKVLKPIGLRTIPAFDTALIAVRVTNLVKNSLVAGQLPPHNELFPIQQHSCLLEGAGPSLQEYKQVLEFKHLTRIIMSSLFQENRSIPKPDNPNMEWPDKQEKEDGLVGWSKIDVRYNKMFDLWCERMYRSLYRLLIQGAVLAPAYHEPFFASTDERPADLMWRILKRLSESSEPLDRYKYYSNLTAQSKDDDRYLHSFAAYPRLGTPMELEGSDATAFGEFAKWLYNDMDQVADAEIKHFRHLLDNETLRRWPVIRQMRHQFRLCAWLETYLSVDRPSWWDMANRDVHWNPFSHGTKFGGMFITEEGTVVPEQSITAILPGIYQPREIIVPTDINAWLHIPTPSTKERPFTSTKMVLSDKVAHEIAAGCRARRGGSTELDDLFIPGPRHTTPNLCFNKLTFDFGSRLPPLKMDGDLIFDSSAPMDRFSCSRFIHYMLEKHVGVVHNDYRSMALWWRFWHGYPLPWGYEYRSRRHRRYPYLHHFSFNADKLDPNFDGQCNVMRLPEGLTVEGRVERCYSNMV